METFHGFGVFKNGVLTDCPALFINGEGFTLSFSMMKDGRPAAGSIVRQYYRGGGYKMSVASKTSKADVSGAINHVMHIDSNGVGQGKVIGSGLIEEGTYKDDVLRDGTRWKINEKGTHD